MGTLAGDLLLMVAAVLGLAALLQTNPTLFYCLQWFGVIYLFWMGAKLAFVRTDEDAVKSTNKLTLTAYFRRAFL